MNERKIKEAGNNTNMSYRLCKLFNNQKKKNLMRKNWSDFHSYAMQSIFYRSLLKLNKPETTSET